MQQIYRRTSMPKYDFNKGVFITPFTKNTSAWLLLKILSNRLGILTQILIAMDYYFFFLHISEKYFQFRKKQKHLLRKILIPAVQVTGSIYCAIVFGTIYISQKCTMLQRNLKNVVKFVRFAYNFPCEKVNFSLIHQTHITIHSF